MRADLSRTPPAAPATSATGCHQLPTSAALHSSLPQTSAGQPTTPFPRHVCRHARQLTATDPSPRHICRHTRRLTATDPPPLNLCARLASASSLPRHLISLSAVRRADPEGPPRATCETVCLSHGPSGAHGPATCPFGQPPPLPGRAAIPKQLASPPAVAALVRHIHQVDAGVSCGLPEPH